MFIFIILFLFFLLSSVSLGVFLFLFFLYSFSCSCPCSSCSKVLAVVSSSLFLSVLFVCPSCAFYSSFHCCVPVVLVLVLVPWSCSSSDSFCCWSLILLYHVSSLTLDWNSFQKIHVKMVVRPKATSMTDHLVVACVLQDILVTNANQVRLVIVRKAIIL